jgi:hypothetical protein
MATWPSIFQLAVYSMIGIVRFSLIVFAVKWYMTVYREFLRMRCVKVVIAIIENCYSTGSSCIRLVSLCDI